MTIDRIGSVDPLQNGKKPDRAGAVRQNSEPDAVSLSTEAVEKGELYRAIELASAVSSLRETLKSRDKQLGEFSVYVSGKKNGKLLE